MTTHSYQPASGLTIAIKDNALVVSFDPMTVAMFDDAAEVGGIVLQVRPPSLPVKDRLTMKIRRR